MLRYSNDENGNCNELGYDPLVDFSMFLEESRKYANDIKPGSSLPPSNPVGKKAVVEDRKSKKSWKKCMFFWWGYENKSTAQHEILTTKASNTNPECSAGSGPITGKESRVGLARWIERWASGRLAGCFIPTRAEETETPYMCLDRHNHPSSVQAFGPIYLVT